MLWCPFVETLEKLFSRTLMTLCILEYFRIFQNSMKSDYFFPYSIEVQKLMTSRHIIKPYLWLVLPTFFYSKKLNCFRAYLKNHELWFLSHTFRSSCTFSLVLRLFWKPNYWHCLRTFSGSFIDRNARKLLSMPSTVIVLSMPMTLIGISEHPDDRTCFEWARKLPIKKVFKMIINIFRNLQYNLNLMSFTHIKRLKFWLCFTGIPSQSTLEFLLGILQNKAFWLNWRTFR